MGPRLRRGGAEKVITLLGYETREGGNKKELQGYTTKGRRTTWCLNSSLVAYAYRRTRASRSYQQRPERLPREQSVKKLSVRLERLPKDLSVKELSTKARAPTEGPERQEVISKARAPTEGPECQKVINKSQSAYRRTRTSRKLSTKT